jgi:tRNA(Ile)-lysidine synthase
VSRSASAADDASPLSAAEAERLFHSLDRSPVLILAVSGGPDSTAMMVLAARWRQSRETPPRLVAVTVDHRLRPASKREAKAVERLARSLGIEHRTLRWTGRKPKTGLQEAARLARYRLLADVARKERAVHVLTAHTRDDQAETVLFRLARGSGVGGLAGMTDLAPVPVKHGAGVMLVRPLLDVPKSRLIATLKAAGIGYADDPTNRDPRFARPRLRALMATLAREGLTPARLATLAARAQRIEDAVMETVDAIHGRLAPPSASAGRPVRLDAELFFRLPDEIALRLLGRLVGTIAAEGPVRLGKLEALFDALCEAAMLRGAEFVRFRRTLAGALVTLDGDRITIERAPPRRRDAPARHRPRRPRRKSA